MGIGDWGLGLFHHLDYMTQIKTTKNFYVDKAAKK